jgi:tetratricopeptide (TPR) repeat protein
MIYYATITASYAADHDRTLELAKVALDYKYDGKGDLYATIAASHKEKGDTLKAKETLAKGFELYPTNQSVLVALINIYMESNDDPEKIIAIIKVAQQNEPTNASLVYAEGNLYRKLNKYQEAIDCFHKSGEMDPTYIFAPFAEGCAYYDWAVEIQNQAQLEMDDAKYNALLEKMEAALNNAAAPFERAFEISQDQEIKVACAEYLKNIFFRQREKSEEGKAKYEKYNSFVENAGN